MKMAYADPPYVGQAKKLYSSSEVNHPYLIQYLMDEFSDGWALSCSSPSLRYLLPLCPDKVRVMAWVKPFAIFKPNVNPAYAWEPIIVYGGRKHQRYDKTIRDWVSVNITLKKGLTGVKPDPFSLWIFDILNLIPEEDEFHDLFTGSGAVGRAWITYPEILEERL